MIVYFIIILAIISRFLPHEANIGMVTALAIFSGSTLSKKQAIAIPLIVRFVSDAFLGFFSWPLMLAVYASHVVGVLFGMWIKNSEHQTSRWSKVFASGLLSSLVFFFVTNFAFLYAPTEYPHTLSGVLLAYTNGLPFLRGTLIGDIGYTVAFFAVYELSRMYIQRRQRALVQV